jgi:hypothetical protein
LMSDWLAVGAGVVPRGGPASRPDAAPACFRTVNILLGD